MLLGGAVALAAALLLATAARVGVTTPVRGAVASMGTDSPITGARVNAAALVSPLTVAVASVPVAAASASLANVT